MLKLQTFFKIFLIAYVSIFAVSLVLNMSPAVHAADKYANPNCKQTSITLSNLFSLAKNIPIIPENCSTDAQGNAVPLSPSLLIDIAIRAYAFMVSLGFTIITPSLVGMGFLYIYSGIDESQAAFVKKWAQNLAVGLLILIFAYFIPFTIMSIFNFNDDQTNLDKFFTFS